MSIVSAAKLAANRRNAQKSTGPRTAAGKKRSSQNARKHGLFAREILPHAPRSENSKAFQRFLNDIFIEMKPRSILERFYLERVALSHWRTQYAYKWEAAAIRNSSDPQSLLPDIPCMSKLVRYENMLDRQLHQSLAFLRQSGCVSGKDRALVGTSRAGAVSNPQA